MTRITIWFVAVIGMLIGIVVWQLGGHGKGIGAKDTLPSQTTNVRLEHNTDPLTPEAQAQRQSVLKDIEHADVRTVNRRLAAETTSDPVLTEGDAYFTPEGERSEFNESRLLAQAAAHMNIKQMAQLNKMRQDEIVRGYDGVVRSPYSKREFCKSGTNDCRTQIVSGTQIIWDGHKWADGYQPTGVGKEVVRVGK